MDQLTKITELTSRVVALEKKCDFISNPDKKYENGKAAGALEVTLKALKTWQNDHEKDHEKEREKVNSLKRTLLITFITLLMGLIISFFWDKIITPPETKIPNEALDTLKALVQEVKELKENT